MFRSCFEIFSTSTTVLTSYLTKAVTTLLFRERSKERRPKEGVEKGEEDEGKSGERRRMEGRDGREEGGQEGSPQLVRGVYDVSLN